MRIRKSAGDTIVEVLIAMAVASAVLGGAYVIVNHTMANARQAQEHAEALKVAQSQVERLRDVYPAHSAFMEDTAKTMCITQAADASAPSQPTVKTSPTSDACKQFDVDKRYEVAIRYISSPKRFDVSVTWDSFNSAAQNKITQSYKVYQP